MKSIILLISLFYTLNSMGQMANRIDKLDVNDLTAKKLAVESTTHGSKPCPKMTQEQRDAIVSPLEGQCVYNSTSKTLNVYDGLAWVEASGGAGGIANWESGELYEVDDVVIYEDEIYQCTIEHTSGGTLDTGKFKILAKDLDLAKGILKMSKGGTEKNLSPVNGGVVYTDSDSMEVLGAGTSGQVLQSNGSAAPSWVDVSIGDGSFEGVLSLEKGGTSKSLTALNGAVPYSDVDSLELLAPGTNNQVLKTKGAGLAPEWGDVALSETTGILPLNRGGTEKALTAETGAIAYSDSNSLELLSPGTFGQILQSNGASNSPSFVNKSIKAKSYDSSAFDLEEINVYNTQLTEYAQNKHLLETGNSNLLMNPSFEHELFQTGWLNVFGTFTEELNVVIHGEKSASLVLANQTATITQDSIYYADQFADAVQGLIKVRIKSDVALRVCSRNAGVTNTNNCLDVESNNKWKLYKLPFILGGTSNGIYIGSTGNVTGTVYIDDAFMGPVDLEAIQTFDTTCDSKECQTQFSAKVGSTGGVSAENYDWITNTTCTAGTTGERTCSIVSGTFTITPNCHCTALDTTGETCTFETQSATSFKIQTVTGGGTATNATVNISCQKTGVDYASAIQAQKDFQKIKINSYAAVVSTNNVDVFSAKVSATDVVSDENVDFINGNCTNATTGFATCIFKPGIFTTTPNCTATISNTGSTLNIVPASTNSTQVTVRTRTSTTDDADLGFNLTCQKQGVDFDSSRLIIGQFNGLEKCSDSYECTDTFSAKVSAAGVVTSENIDWLNGNCTIPSTGIFSCNLKANVFIQIPACVITSNDTGGTPRIVHIQNLSTTGITYRSLSTASFVSYDSAVEIICQKQGSDYIGKVAKAVASDQSIATPGVTRMKACYYAFGGAEATLSSPTECTTGTCTEVVDTCGTGSPPSFSSAGLYTNLTFQNNTFKPLTFVNCSCVAFDTSVSTARYCTPRFESGSNTWASDSNGGFKIGSFITNSQTGTLGDSYISVKCEGQSPN